MSPVVTKPQCSVEDASAAASSLVPSTGFLFFGLLVSLTGSHWIRLFSSQPREFDDYWAAPTFLYVVSLITAFLLARPFSGVTQGWRSRFGFPLLAALAAANINAMLCVWLGDVWRGAGTWLIFCIGTLFLFPLLAGTPPTDPRVTWLKRASFLLVFISLGQDLIEIGRYSASPGRSPGETRGISNTPLKSEQDGPHVIHLVLDALAGLDLIEDPELASTSFVKDMPAGIYFPRTYSNGHKTSVSVRQFFSGKFNPKGAKTANISADFRESGYETFKYSEVIATSRFGKWDASFDRKWAVKQGMYGGRPLDYFRFQVNQALHAYFMRFGLSLIGDRLSVLPSASASSKDTLRARGSSVTLVLFDKFLNDLSRHKYASYRYLHVMFPHPPNIHDRNCNVIGDPSQIAQDVADFFGPAYKEQMLCANILVKRLTARLRELGLFDRSLIVIQSDHGKGPGYLSFVKDPGIHRKAPRPEELNRTVEERARALLWIKPPFEKRNIVRNHLALLVDVAPTIRAAAGLTAKDSDGFDLLEGGTPDRFKFLDSRSVYAFNSYSDGQKSYYLKRTSGGEWRQAGSSESLKSAKKQFIVNAAIRK